jgi:hypothetical protein
MRSWTIHIQKPGAMLETHCGRRIGTPGGKIFPGVHAELESWFREHPYPEVIAPGTCKACRKLAGKGKSDA